MPPPELYTRSLMEDLAPLQGPDATRDLAQDPTQPNSYRLAFADPEFMSRREVRGIRFQLELLKPDLDQEALGIQHTIVVYGSARFVDAATAAKQLQQAQASGDAQAIALAQRAVRNAAHYEAARQFAHLVAHYSSNHPTNQRVYVCTGGGPGIMEAANRGAYDAGAPTIGLNILLPHEQHGNPYIAPGLSFKFHYFALRKMHFLMRAKALVAFPGGFGTLDELFETLTLVQTRKVPRVPIIMVGKAFWDGIINFPAMADAGVISPEDVELLSWAETAQEIWALIQAFYAP